MKQNFCCLIINLCMEIWKDVEGYEGSYQVSNLGRVKSLARRVNNRWGSEHPVRERILKPSIDKDGYLKVSLQREGTVKCISVHRLVAMVFIPNQTNQPQVNHLNGVKTDNQVENLEWTSCQENILHAWKTGLNSYGVSKEDVDRVFLLDRQGWTNGEISKEMSIDRTYVSSLLRGRFRKMDDEDREYLSFEEDKYTTKKCKYSDEDIQKIHQLRTQGLTCKAIANIIGCSKGHVSVILRGKTRKLKE